MADDGWLETAKISIAAQGGSNVSFASLTETVAISGGVKAIEGIPLLNGGRLTKFTPETDTEVTFEAYTRDAGTDTGTTGKGFFDLLHTADTTQPVVVTNSRTRNKYRVAIMWTDANVDATGAVSTPTNEAMRFVGADGYFESVEQSFTDGVLKATVKFKVPAFDKSGSSNVKWESITGTGTSTLTALTAYSALTKW